MSESNPLFWIVLSGGAALLLWGLAIVLDHYFFTPYLTRVNREEDRHG
ncbi:hypothetical protein [Streptomyces kaniharaensis]|nr:hypothetical protein [Streptomyces kaniharaensis]